MSEEEKKGFKVVDRRGVERRRGRTRNPSPLRLRKAMPGTARPREVSKGEKALRAANRPSEDRRSSIS